MVKFYAPQPAAPISLQSNFSSVLSKYNFFYSVIKRFKLVSLLFLLVLSYSKVSAQFTITENFKSSSAGNNIILGGGLTSDPAKLTSGIEDPVGNGWLRLTKASGNQSGFAYVNTPFPSTLGVFIDFEYKTWRSSADGYNGADGLTLFLFDAGVPFNIGGYGGSLGYAPNPAAGTSTGLAGGYIGIGLDEYGNFSTANANEGRVGGTTSLRPNSVVLRGPTTNSALTTNAFLTGVTLKDNTVYSNSTIGDGTQNEVDYNSVTTTRPTDAQFYRRVQVQVVPSNGLYVITVKWTKTPNGIFTTLLTYTTAVPPPANLKLGFAASTGGGYNNHDIRNLLITTPGGVRTDKSVDKANALVGDQLTYTVMPTILLQRQLQI